MNEVLEYLDSKNLTYKVVDRVDGKEARLKLCPFCGDNGDHLYLNLQTHQFFCQKCNVGGGILTLKKQLGDIASIVPIVQPTKIGDIGFSEEETKQVYEAHQRLFSNKKVLRYVFSRKFSKVAIRHFKLGYSIEDGIEWLWFPYFKNGKIYNVKKRSISGEKAFKRWFGKKSELFNADALNGSPESIYICEGESDTIALWSAGITNVVGVTIGAGGINNEWIEVLDKFQKIYICYDQDKAGLEGAYKFVNRLGVERCYQVKLPSGIKDINEFFIVGHTKQDFKFLVDKAKVFDVQYVSHFSSEIERGIQRIYLSEKEQFGLSLPWPKVDRLINKFIPGDLIVLSGIPGVGKSSFAFNLLYYFSKQLAIPSLLFSLEMRPERIMPRFVALHKRVDSKIVMNDVPLLTQSLEEFKDVPLYLAYVYKKPTFDICADTIRLCLKRYGIGFVVFDNLHFLIRSLTEQTKEVSLIIQSFKLLAEELAIPIVVIARPRKFVGKIMRNVDLKDSADIEGDADIVILIHRDRKGEGDYIEAEGNFKEETLVMITKCRYAPGGQTYLRTIDSECRVEEM